MEFSKLSHFPDFDQQVEIEKYSAHLNVLARDGSTHFFNLDIPGSDQKYLLMINPSNIDAAGKPVMN